MKIGDLLLNVSEGTKFRGVARILRKRKMGQVCFFNVRFQEDFIQIMMNKHLDNYEVIVNLALGSLIRIAGFKTTTLSGEATIKIETAIVEYEYKGKLPDKKHGLSCANRYRNRVMDLTINNDAFLLVHKMSVIYETIRKILSKYKYHEFCTGVLQEYFEAGQANSFSTNCRANSKTLHLSLTSELKLKRLIVAGFDRVYEIAQSFRNEGIDSMHSPEFTLLEIYAVDSNYQQMMDLLELLIKEVVKVCEGDDRINDCQDSDIGNIFLENSFQRLSFREAFEQMIGPWNNCNIIKLSELMPDLFNCSMTNFTWLMKLIEKKIVPNILMPTFLTNLPADMSPFVKNNGIDNGSDRAFLIVKGVFLADIYTDENNPDVVNDLLRKQSDYSGNQLNHQYLEVLKFGIPPTAGIGLGINRLMMLFLGNLPKDIKETILYPII